MTEVTPLANVITIMEAHLNHQNERIQQLEECILNLEGNLIQTKAGLMVRDPVIEGAECIFSKPLFSY